MIFIRFFTNMLHYILKSLGWAAFVITALIILCNYVLPKLHERYFGKFKQSAKLKLHTTIEIGYLRIYIVRIKDEFMPRHDNLDEFIDSTYETMGLAHAEQYDMERLQCCNGIAGLATMTVSSKVDQDSVMSIHFEHRRHHGVEMTTVLPPQSKYNLLAAIDLSRSAKSDEQYQRQATRAAA